VTVELVPEGRDLLIAAVEHLDQLDRGERLAGTSVERRDGPEEFLVAPPQEASEQATENERRQHHERGEEGDPGIQEDEHPEEQSGSRRRLHCASRDLKHEPRGRRSLLKQLGQQPARLLPSEEAERQGVQVIEQSVLKGRIQARLGPSLEPTRAVRRQLPAERQPQPGCQRAQQRPEVVCRQRRVDEALEYQQQANVRRRH